MTNNNISPSLHPQFRAKAACRLTCKSCLADVCMRGMKAILLADSRVELYSTDRPPKGTRYCKCRIRDVACLGCGNTLGYHVTQPCESCLKACNNGCFIRMVSLARSDTFPRLHRRRRHHYHHHHHHRQVHEVVDVGDRGEGAERKTILA
ncbi:MAG: FAM72 protein-domain-containing protein [Benniella sp.]|nr:MAG: FAM72 protein-domain-containing protein [Benniella sp.]